MINNISIPKDLKQIKIDVGLAGEAPNSCIWLSETPDRFVIGIEPLESHWKDLHTYTQFDRSYPNFKMLQLDQNAVMLNKEVVCLVNNRFFEIHGAIDSVPEPTVKGFYKMEQKGGSSGSSSLLKPTQHHPHKVDEIVRVDVYSLEYILSLLDWERFPYIEHIKTDCEGKDFDVVKSIGKYLDKIVFISSEASGNSHHWYGSGDNNRFESYMIDEGFKVLSKTNGNIDFINPKYNDIIIRDNLNNKTLGE